MRYYFHVHDGQDWPDHEGTELPSLNAARSLAAKRAGELLQHSPEVFWTGDEWRMDVKDETGLILFCLLFAAIDSAATMGTRR